MWYQVILEEDVKHFFLSGWFPPMKAKVQSVARFTHYVKGDNLFEQTLAIAEKQTYQSWDHIKMENDSNTVADNRSVLSNGNKYREGDKHRFEILRLGGYGGKGGDTRNPYTSRGNVDQTGYDDLFIDWRPDMKGMTKEDLDIGIKDGVSGHNSWTHFYSDNSKLTGYDNLIRRIHGVINFEPLNGKFPYPVREGKDPPDPLYARIESEPVLTPTFAEYFSSRTAPSSLPATKTISRATLSPRNSSCSRLTRTASSFTTRKTMFITT